MNNYFLHPGVTKKVEFHTFENLCHVFINVSLAQSTSCVVLHNSVLSVECKQEN